MKKAPLTPQGSSHFFISLKNVEVNQRQQHNIKIEKKLSLRAEFHKNNFHIAFTRFF
jgi:hypothetical protein